MTFLSSHSEWISGLQPPLDTSPDRVRAFSGAAAISFYLAYADRQAAAGARKILLVVLNEDEAGTKPAWASKLAKEGEAVIYCEPRGIGATKWTMKNPPNYVARSLALVGETVDTGRVWDVVAATRHLGEPRQGQADSGKTVSVAGKGAAGLLAAYAAVLNEKIAGVTIFAPPSTHMDNAAPQFLNVLRVCDVPDALGLIAPRPLTILDAPADKFTNTTAAYAAASATDKLAIK